jgi:hypothetical protein
MKRILPLLGLALMACGELPTQPNVDGQRLEATTYWHVDVPGVEQFTDPTTCTASGSSITCTFTIANYTGGGDPYSQSVQVDAWYSVQYRCVNEKTGKTSKQYPVSTVEYSAVLRHQLGVPSSDTFAGLAAPALSTNPCSTNKGQMTRALVVSDPIPVRWQLQLFVYTYLRASASDVF